MTQSLSSLLRPTLTGNLFDVLVQPQTDTNSTTPHSAASDARMHEAGSLIGALALAQLVDWCVCFENKVIEFFNVFLVSL